MPDQEEHTTLDDLWTAVGNTLDQWDSLPNGLIGALHEEAPGFYAAVMQLLGVTQTMDRGSVVAARVRAKLAEHRPVIAEDVPDALLKWGEADELVALAIDAATMVGAAALLQRETTRSYFCGMGGDLPETELERRLREMVLAGLPEEGGKL